MAVLAGLLFGIYKKCSRKGNHKELSEAQSSSTEEKKPLALLAGLLFACKICKKCQKNEYDPELSESQSSSTEEKEPLIGHSENIP